MFDWRSDDVRFEECGVHNGKVVVRWVVNERIHSGTNDDGGKTGNED